MRVKKFVGSTMQEAVGRMREEFGPEAVILDTRWVRSGGLFGLLGRKRVEVTAVLEGGQRQASAFRTRKTSALSTALSQADTGWDDNLYYRPGRLPAIGSSASKPGRNRGESFCGEDTGAEAKQRTIVKQGKAEPVVPAGLGQQVYRRSLSSTRQPQSQLQEAFSPELNNRNGSEPRKGEEKARNVSLPKPLAAVHSQLVSSDVDERLATAILRSIRPEIEKSGADYANAVRQVRERMTAMLKCVPPWEFSEGPKIVILLGPTGVGKTTTLAKIAANYGLIAGVDVGLLTIDTYRIAAVEQLRVYAELIGIPLEVARNPQEVQKAIKRLAGKDLILVDTAGRSQRNGEHMQELREMLAALPGVERHLVFSATTRCRDLMDIIRRFQAIGFDRLIATKLDETTSYGILLTAYAAARRPFSFLTDGQVVPDDIQVAEAAHIAKLIVGEI